MFSLFGHNASGKSTLLKILSGIMKPDSGNIFLNGKDICAVFQENIVPSGFKIIDFLLFYSKIVKSPYRKKDIISLAESYGIKNEDMKKKITHLSGGTKKKIEFLKSIINKDALFHLFDEPTIGFDPESQKIAWDHIRNLKKEDNIIGYKYEK
ncbi:ATP-binding cassette domain-containing protein [Marinitoga sp. 38H-ov]|uniref:ATP-binding cassette domain-containing protein n=1 Tax=Marinitoga sp. 38H-ov TaxID=1755814 RepID=UPI001F495B50|nr:ATP-binding cassette domain-containing protein [Marinitoga sp. 38H-ov]